MSLLQGKVALVTGGARGIGLSIARSLGAEGARLVLVDNGCERDGSGADGSVVAEATSELQRSGLDVRGHFLDVADGGAVAGLFDELAPAGWTPDVLVNNAGIVRDRSLLQMDEADFDIVLRTHLRGTFLFTARFAQALRAQKRGGSIVNLTSVSALLGNIGQINESAAKAGVYGLTRTASIELQKYGIAVNAVAPIARTRLTEDLPMFEKVQGTLEPEHVAPLIVYLASHLSEGVSGQAFSVAGGRIARLALAESRGRTKQADGGLWTPQEIADNFDAISKM